MLFLITDILISLAEGPKEEVASQKAREALEYLDIATRLGRHLVCLQDYSLFDRLKHINIRVSSILNLQSRYVFDKSIVSTIGWHVELLNVESSYRDDDKQIIFVSLYDIPSFELFSEVYVIGENYKDVDFFECILSYFKEVNHFEIDSHFHKLLGGGSTTSEVLRQEQNIRQSFVICISDSDYAFRGSKLGDTAKKIEKVYIHDLKSASPFVIYYHYKDVSEVENLIPISLFNLYALINPDIGVNYKEIKKLLDINNIAYHYIDLKDGLSLRSFEKMEYDDRLFEMYEAMMPDIKERARSDKEFLSAQKPQLSNEDMKEEMKKKKYIVGLGPKILNNLLQAFSIDDFVREMKQSATQSQKGEYEAIGKLLYDWCCSRPKERV